MSEKSLRDRALDYLKQWHAIDPYKFINGGELERLALEAGYKSSNISRRLREMVNEGLLERRLNQSGTVEYRYGKT